MAETQIDKSNTPPYVPFLTFKAFIESLSKTAVPAKIDRSIMPRLSGGAQNQLVSALKFLKLIGSSGDTQEPLRTLVKSFGQQGVWESTLSEIIFDAYQPILQGIDIDTASSKSLRDNFRDIGGVDGQMGEKTIRFFIKAMKESGTTYSPHFAVRSGGRPPGRRQPAIPGRVPKARMTPPEDIEQNENHNAPLPGTLVIPIHLPGKPLGKVIIPEDLSEPDCEMIDAILRAYAKRRSDAPERRSK